MAVTSDLLYFPTYTRIGCYFVGMWSSIIIIDDNIFNNFNVVLGVWTGYEYKHKYLCVISYLILSKSSYFNLLYI